MAVRVEPARIMRIAPETVAKASELTLADGVERVILKYEVAGEVLYGIATFEELRSTDVPGYVIGILSRVESGGGR